MSRSSLVALLCALAVCGGAFVNPVKIKEGTLAAVNKAENTLSLIDLTTGKTHAKLPTGPHPQEVVFSPDGSLGVVSNMGQGGANMGKTLTLVDLANQKVKGEIQLGDHGAPHGVIFLDKDTLLYTSHQSDSLVSVNLTVNKVEKAVASGGKGTHLVVLAPDKKTAYTVNAVSQDVSVIDLTTWKVTKRIACGTRAEGISISPDGRQVAVGNVGGNTVSIIDTAKNEVVKTLEGTMTPIRTFYTSDSSKLLVSCAATGDLAVFDAKTLAEIKRIPLGEIKDLQLVQGPNPIPMNFDRHPAGGYFFVVIINANAVVMFDEANLKVERVFSTGNLPDGIGVTAAKPRIGA
jgi:YVTN family beta-propeller protein